MYSANFNYHSNWQQIIYSRNIPIDLLQTIYSWFTILPKMESLYIRRGTQTLMFEELFSGQAVSGTTLHMTHKHTEAPGHAECCLVPI